MDKQLDTIIVIDVESTCWEGDPPPGQRSEIIEIGLCLLEVTTGERTDFRSILVKPRFSTISPYCHKLTSLTKEMVAEGMDFEDACALLVEKFDTKRRTWASYGDYDRLQFMKQSEALDIPYPFGRSHINVKNLLALQHALSKEVNLDQAMTLLGLRFEGRLHRGVDDAWNIAAVLSRVLFAGHR
jgi:inhibitor of KinA sporulation pathway (predicted exonuclease)